MNRKITIRDVAKYAGVSVATVSYVINGVNRVSDATKKKILEAIKHLGYKPDFTAISLSKKQSKMLCVVFDLIEGGTLSPIFYENPYYSEFIRGLEYISRKNGYDVLISGVSKPEDCQNLITKRNLDGLISLGVFNRKIYEEMKTLTIPVVMIDKYEEFANHSHTIRIDDELGGYLATKHLIDYGHTGISFISPELTNNPVDKKRLLGYKRALNESNIFLNEDLIIEIEGASLKDGYKVGGKILEFSNRISAIFVTADILALGIIKFLNEHHKEVSKDYSIVGFDNISISGFMTPGLTTISQDIFNKGVAAGQILIDDIEGRISKPKNVNLSVELMIRDSTRLV
jgi:DNA-binding LacI/PurR family transcriptional regulator